MYFICCGHDECLEVRGLEDDNVVIVCSSLVVIIMTREEVSLLVEVARLASQYEVVLN